MNDLVVSRQIFQHHGSHLGMGSFMEYALYISIYISWNEITLLNMDSYNAVPLWIAVCPLTLHYNS